MLLSSVIPTLFSLLAVTGSVAAAASHSPRSHHHRAALTERAERAQVLAQRGISVGAPHYSLYLYDNLSSGNWPSADKISPYNRVLLAFWADSGASGAAQVWAGLSATQRSSILDSYHNAGIAVLVSAFGAGDNVISNKADPVKTAQDIAAWVNQYGVDGVDIDFEDFTPLQSNQAYALDWLTKFHTQLRTSLPSSIISSAAAAWTYGNQFGSANSVSCQLHKAVGDKIDWYNMQFYNGAVDTWDTCEHLFWNAGNKGFLSVKEISDQCGIPMSMIAIGKLWNTAELAHAGTDAQIPAPADFGSCLATAKATIGYPQTGIMIWVAEMNSWSSAINYLSNTLSSMNSNNANPSVGTTASAAGTSAAAAASVAASDAAAASAASVAGESAAPTTTVVTSADGTVVTQTVSVADAASAVLSTTVSTSADGTVVTQTVSKAAVSAGVSGAGASAVAGAGASVSGKAANVSGSASGASGASAGTTAASTSGAKHSAGAAAAALVMGGVAVALFA